METSFILLGVAWLMAALLALRERASGPLRRQTASRGEKAEARASGSIASALQKTRAVFSQRLRAALGATAQVDDDALERLLIESDVGVRATKRLLEAVAGSRSDPDARLSSLRARLLEILAPAGTSLADPANEISPWVCLVVGVNGVGKTTTIGKLAAAHGRLGRKVLLVAGDTFRAAAAEQLTHWAERAGAEIVRHQDGADPSAVVHDGLSAAQARSSDIVLVDTAGRLHTRANLMEELAKIVRVAGRLVPGAPHAVLLVLDATTGQNGLAQAREFSRAAGVTGIVLTKLDGSARGGIALAIREELGLPILWVGVGEGLEDLIPFDPERFIDELLGHAG